MSSSFTKAMLSTWLDVVVKPFAMKAMRDGLPLDTFGASLVGYGISMLRGAGWSVDRIRTEVVEPTLAGPVPRKPD